jgi:hypothetical protein
VALGLLVSGALCPPAAPEGSRREREPLAREPAPAGVE